MVDRIYLYDDYDRFALSNDPMLWWHTFTGKQPPRYMTETRRWYNRNPNPNIILDDLDDDEPAVAQAVAVATAARELDDVGYMS